MNSLVFQDIIVYILPQYCSDLTYICFLQSNSLLYNHYYEYFLPKHIFLCEEIKQYQKRRKLPSIMRIKVESLLEFRKMKKLI